MCATKSVVASNTAKNSNNVALLLIFIVFLDTTGVAIVLIQLMPRLIELGATPVIAGCIGALYGAVQLFSSPYVGGISDKANKKTVLIVTILLSALGYTFLGFQSLLIFTISRIMSGLFKHTHSISMACIADLVKTNEKEKYFGFFGGGIGAGFVVGPVISGFLAQRSNGFQLMSYITTAVFITNSLLIWKLLPQIRRKQNDSKKTTQENLKSKKQKGNGIMRYFEELGIEGCWDVYVLQGLLEIGMMVNFTHLGLVMAEDYGLEPKDMGLFIAILSLVGIITSALSSKITKLFGEDKIISFMFGVTLVGFIVLCLRPALSIYFCAILFISISTTLLRNGWAHLVTSRCAPEKSGKVIGVLHGVAAVAGMLAPLLGGIISQISGTCHSTTILTTLFVVMGFITCFWFPRPKSKIKKN